jgi:hypothetical protein
VIDDPSIHLTEEKRMSTVTTKAKPAQHTYDSLLELSRQELVDLWYTLPAPPFTELNGDYPIYLQKSRSNPKINEFYDKTQWNVNSPRVGPSGGKLLCKVYKPLGQVTGEGYCNWEMPDGSVQRRFRFGTHLGMSVHDGRPAFIMNYAAFQGNDAGKADLRDEVRKVTEGLYIGIGAFSMSAANDDNPMKDQARVLLDLHGVEHNGNEPFWKFTPPKCGAFILTGPTGPAVGVDDPDAEKPY